ncbi:hypothetical protein TNCV_2590821 [Trichonephila clavipes]|nr:hypothetical protein TNCV_2590821 [Trichonephila clavipes]
MHSAFAAWEYSKQLSSRMSSRKVGGRGLHYRGGKPLTLHPGVVPLNSGETELNRTITCMVAKNMRKYSPLMNFVVLDLIQSTDE